MKLSDKKREHLINFLMDAAEDNDLKDHRKQFNETATILINGRSIEQVNKMEMEQFGQVMGQQ